MNVTLKVGGGSLLSLDADLRSNKSYPSVKMPRHIIEHSLDCDLNLIAQSSMLCTCPVLYCIYDLSDM